MTDPTPAEVIAFLNGEAALEGNWFGEMEGQRGSFWWRKYLPILSPTPADAGEVREKVAREALFHVRSQLEALEGRTQGDRARIADIRWKITKALSLLASPQVTKEKDPK